MELLKAIERAETAEAMVEMRNIEISRLREELKKVEEEKCKTISKLKADIALMQDKSDCRGAQILAGQLLGNSQEHSSYYLKRRDFGHHLGRQRRKHTKQIKEKMTSLGENNMDRLEQDLKDGLTLQCRSVEKPKAHKQVSLEVEQHLNRLTSYVQNLETCIRQGAHLTGNNKQSNGQQHTSFAAPVEPVTFFFKSSNSMHITNMNGLSQNQAISTASVKNSFELDMLRDNTQDLVTSKQQACLHQNQKIVSWSRNHSQEKLTALATVDVPKKFTNLLSRCISWKWRWAAAASQLKALSKELQNMTITTHNKALGALATSPASGTNRDKFFMSMQKLGFIHAQNLHSSPNRSKGRHVPAKSKQKDAKFCVSGHKVISIMLSMWRASIKNAKLEKEAVCKGEKLSRLLSGLPWLIQRIEERRHLERMFYHWVLHMLRSKVQVYHTSDHQLGSWSCWQKRYPSSLWVAQSGLPDVRRTEGNGYQGRYMRYGFSKPNERQVILAGTRKASNKRPERNDDTMNYQECLEHPSPLRTKEDFMDGCSSESSYSAQKDNNLYPCHNRCLTTAVPQSISTSNKNMAGQDGSTAASIDDFPWNKNYHVTSFTEKAMQNLQVLLYNELQKLQDLIVSEAQLHQEKAAREKDGSTAQDEMGSNASPFISSSLWRICNGLAHCLIEARNQILALARDPESKACGDDADAATESKARRNSNLLASHHHRPPSNKGNERTYQRTQISFVKNKSKSQEYKSRQSSSSECETKQGAGNAEILEFVAAGI